MRSVTVSFSTDDPVDGSYPPDPCFLPMCSGPLMSCSAPGVTLVLSITNAWKPIVICRMCKRDWFDLLPKDYREKTYCVTDMTIIHQMGYCECE